jgi:hypothetical protein
VGVRMLGIISHAKDCETMKVEDRPDVIPSGVGRNDEARGAVEISAARDVAAPFPDEVCR